MRDRLLASDFRFQTPPSQAIRRVSCGVTDDMANFHRDSQIYGVLRKALSAIAYNLAVSANMRIDCSMTPEQRQRIIEILLSGGEIAPEWSRILFPARKRNMNWSITAKERENIIANTLAGVPFTAVRINKNGVGGKTS